MPPQRSTEPSDNTQNSKVVEILGENFEKLLLRRVPDAAAPGNGTKLTMSEVLATATDAFLTSGLLDGIPYLEAVTKCIAAVVSWKGCDDQNQNNASRFAKHLGFLVFPLQQLHGVRDRLCYGDPRLEDIIGDVGASAIFICNFRSTSKLTKFLRAKVYKDAFSELEKRIQEHKSTLTLIFHEVNLNDRNVRPPETPAEAMMFLGRYKKYRGGFAEFQGQSHDLSGDHWAAERCRVILRNHWEEKLAELRRVSAMVIVVLAALVLFTVVVSPAQAKPWLGTALAACVGLMALAWANQNTLVQHFYFVPYNLKDLVTRGNNYRKLVEPLDIANYYRLKLHLEPEKLELRGQRHYLESDNRPTRYIVLEELYKKTYPKNNFVSSIETAELEMA